MKRLSTIAALLLAAALQGASAAPALAAAPPAGAARAPALTDAQKAEVAKAEQWLNGVTTLKSDFMQVGHDGGVANGTFSLSRPGRMRIDYAEPVKNFIVADGRFVYFWDAEMKEQSNAPIGSTLADFLLRSEIKLSGDVTVTDVQSGGGVSEITLIRTGEASQGRMTLVFEERPYRLRKWRVIDAQNLMTEVALLNPQTGVTLDQNQFFFRDPGKKRERD